MSDHQALVRRFGQGTRVLTSICAALGLLGAADADAQQSGELNPNQRSMRVAIRDDSNPQISLCPQLARDSESLNEVQTDLWTRCRRVLTATDSAGQANALQEITAEELTAPSANAVDFNRSQRSQVTARLSALRGVRGPGAIAYLDGNGGFAFDTTGGASGDGSSDGRLGLFVNGKLGQGDKDETSFEAAYDFDVTGLTAGVDFRFTDSLVAGVALGYATSETDFNTGGSLDSDDVAGSVFGSWYGANAYVDLVFTYSTLSLDSERHVAYVFESIDPVDGPVTESIDHVASGDTDGDTTALGLSAGYNFGGDNWRFGPTAAVSYLEVNIDGFSESGGNNPELNLQYGDQEAKSLQLQLGFDVSYLASTSWGVLSPYARASYVWEQENDQETFFIRYVADPYSIAPDGTPTTASVTSDDPDDSFLLWAAGLSAAFANGFSAFVDYESVASLDTVSYGEVTLGIRYEFR